MTVVELDWEIHLTSGDDNVGLVELNDDSQFETTSNFDLDLLREMVDLADEVGWESVTVSVGNDRPILLSREESDISLAVTPLLSDE